MDKVELKSCPFCGYHKTEKCHDDGLSWDKCRNCGATGPATTRYSGEEDSEHLDWSSRVIEAETAALRAELDASNAVIRNMLAARGPVLSEWVPVSERLPEPFVHVGLLNANRFENCPDVMDGRNHLKDVGYLRTSYALDQQMWSVRGARSVLIDAYTHWVPLPAAPKEEV